MRALLWTDMEGMSAVDDHRQCWPSFEQYWETGRRAFTEEVRSAALGLLDGGATDVFVVNGHGLGWPNLIWDDMPDRVVPADDQAFGNGFDAMFQVGFHARIGTTDAFMSHTMVPGLTVLVDDAPVTESHIWAWMVGIPVLGISGDAALGPQVDGILSGTPFLPVKQATGRGSAHPLHADSAGALREFAADCARRPRRELKTPDTFSLTAVLDEDLAQYAVGQAGLHLKGPGEVARQAANWARDAQPALMAAVQAALRPLFAAQGDLNLSSLEAMRKGTARDLACCRQFFEDWASEPDRP